MTKQKNPWDNADAFLMAIRLRRKGLIYPEVEELHGLKLVVVQSLSHVQLFATPWTTACQISLSFTILGVCSNSCLLSR